MSGRKTELQQNFEVAVDAIKNSDPEAPKRPNNDEKLKFYGLYKQATCGDCNTTQPWAFQVVERAKWDAWNANKGMSKKDAMTNYCELYLDASDKYGI